MSLYPNSPLINTSIKHKPEVIRALHEFKNKKPWHGGRKGKHRLQCMKELLADLTRIYGMSGWALYHNPDAPNNGICDPITRTITIFGELSIITLLHEFAHARFGRDERKAVKWSTNLFVKVFPKQAEHLITEGHMLQREETLAEKRRKPYILIQRKVIIKR